jgi:(2Fe-2S) ferredoxin
MSDEKPFFAQHLFICMNQRDDGRECCAGKGAKAAQKYLKERTKELKLNRDAEVRVNQSGCLGRCEEGPVIVIYPQGTWYTYVDNEDLDEIIDAHLIGGKIVERLKI